MTTREWYSANREAAIASAVQWNRDHAERRREIMARYRAKNRERLREESRAYSEEHRQRAMERSAESRRRHPDRVLARNAVYQAIQRGDLVRPFRCEECGAEAVVEAHHEDYSKRLEVEFLCKECHGRRGIRE